MLFGGLEVTKRVKQSRFEHPHRARANKRQNMRGCCCWPRAVLIESSIASRIEVNNFVHVQVLVSRCPTKKERPFELLKAYHSNIRAFNFSLLPFLQFSTKAFLLRPPLIDSFLFFRRTSFFFYLHFFRAGVCAQLSALLVIASGRQLLLALDSQYIPTTERSLPASI